MPVTRQEFDDWKDRFHGTIQSQLKAAFDRAGALELGFSVHSAEKESGISVHASLFNWVRHRGEGGAPIPAEAVRFLKDRIADSLPGASVDVRNCDIPIMP